MKNVNESMLKTALFIELDEFKKLVTELTGEDCSVDYDVYDDLCVTDEGMEALKKHFDINITSIHADDYDTVGVWIIYI